MTRTSASRIRIGVVLSLTLLLWGVGIARLSGVSAVPQPAHGRRTLARLDFNTALAVEAALLRAQLPGAFTVRVSSPYVVASDLGPAQLDRVIAQTLQAATKALFASYIQTAPPAPVRTYLFAGRTSYVIISRILWKDENPEMFGYSSPVQDMMVMDISTGGGTLIHELTHILLWADFPAIPIWFNEALGSLHEAVEIHPDRLVGLPNWRGASVKDALRRNSLRSLDELVSDPDFYGKNVVINYAHARYFCLFLQDRCDLKRFYRLMKASQGAKALTHAAAACSISESRLEKEFRAYLPRVLAP